MQNIGRVLFARIGWMHYYKGLMPGDDRVVGGGQWNESHVGGEVFNFRDVGGWLYAYMEARGSISLERIDPAKPDDEQLNRALVIFVARRPSGGQVIVGWYAHAVVLRHCVTCERRREGIVGIGAGPSGKYSYAKAKASGAVLLPLHKRLFDGVPAGKGGMGQSNICYVIGQDGSPKKSAWIRDAVAYVNSYRGPNLLTDQHADAEQDMAEKASDIVAGGQGQGFAQNVPQRKAIERHAMCRAMAYFRKHFTTVEDVSATRSYDLECRTRASVLRVEVKGTTGDGSTVFLTRNEVRQARKGDVALFIQHSIKLRKNRASAGQSVVHWPWKLSQGILQPMAFAYKPPKPHVGGQKG